MARKGRGIVTVQRAVERLDGIAAKKQQAAATAREHGHTLGPWRKRTGDKYGRWDAHCKRKGCQGFVTVAIMAPAVYDLADIYGTALHEHCQKL